MVLESVKLHLVANTSSEHKLVRHPRFALSEILCDKFIVHATVTSEKDLTWVQMCHQERQFVRLHVPRRE